MVRLSTIAVIGGIAAILLPIPLLPPFVSAAGAILLVAGIVLRVLGM